jgi:hypothetical protein
VRRFSSIARSMSRRICARVIPWFSATNLRRSVSRASSPSGGLVGLEIGRDGPLGQRVTERARAAGRRAPHQCLDVLNHRQRGHTLVTHRSRVGHDRFTGSRDSGAALRFRLVRTSGHCVHRTANRIAHPDQSRTRFSGQLGLGIRQHEYKKAHPVADRKPCLTYARMAASVIIRICRWRTRYTW